VARVLVAAALCPHPPVVVPEVATGAAAELDGLRAACDEAIAALLESRPDTIVVVGNGPRTEEFAAGAGGDLRRYGVDVQAGGGGAELPLALTIGAWLLDRSGTTTARRYLSIASEEAPARAAGVGAAAVGGAERVALLVMADGSARRTETSPGPYHPDAVAFDERVTRALAALDTDELLAIDEETCRTLWAGGRTGWQALAGATSGSGRLTATIRYDEAPYGIGYLVVSWS
jgi:aromatic ring-opening dioxygenase LigB subunit